MKKFSLIIFCILLCFHAAKAQVHLSHFFDLKTEVTLTDIDIYGSHWTGTCDEKGVFFCQNLVPWIKKKGFILNLYHIDFQTKEQQIIEIVLPEKAQAIPWDKQYWVYNLYADSAVLLLTTQEQIFEYERLADNKFIFRQALNIENGDFAIQNKGEIFGISQINDVGFSIQRQAKGKDADTSLLTLPAAFLLQFAPNGFLKYSDESFYFLKTPEPILQKIDVHGKIIQEIKFDFADWNNMPKNYISETAQMPYGPDRAMYVFNSSERYSFPLEIFPFNAKTMLLAYHQFDEDLQHFGIQLRLLRVSPDGLLREAIPVRASFPLEQTILKEEFPVYYADRALVFSCYGKNTLVQLVKEPDITYYGKTGKEYAEEKNAYFLKKDPVLRLRVMELKKTYQNE